MRLFCESPPALVPRAPRRIMRLQYRPQAGADNSPRHLWRCGGRTGKGQPPRWQADFVVKESFGMSKNAQKIGWIGAGRMGAPMAERLLKAGHDVTIWN